MEHTPTWFNTLANHRGFGGCFGCMDDMVDMAHNLGYSYICWADRIYYIEMVSSSTVSAYPNAANTGLIINDVK